MACDAYSRTDAGNLLQNKFIYFFGDSNVRALYKDLTWLLEDGRLVQNSMLKTKNEMSHANDLLLRNGTLHNGLNYQEVRDYMGRCHLRFEFITRLFLSDFMKSVESLDDVPDVVVINSCIWDLTRWGPSGVQQYKTNLQNTFVYLKNKWSQTRIIWLSVLPPSFSSIGGFLTEDIKFLRNMLPWHIVFANQFAVETAKQLNVDVLDYHYHFRFLMNYHTKDGIHWAPIAMRFATNLLLSHLALIWNRKLPKVFLISNKFLQDTSKQATESVPTAKSIKRNLKRKYKKITKKQKRFFKNV